MSTNKDREYGRVLEDLRRMEFVPKSGEGSLVMLSRFEWMEVLHTNRETGVMTVSLMGSTSKGTWRAVVKLVLPWLGSSGFSFGYMRQILEDEYYLLLRLEKNRVHEGVCQARGFVRAEQGANDSRMLGIVMDYYGPHLWSSKKPRTLSWMKAASIRLAEVVTALHAHRVVHADIKVENVLLSGYSGNAFDPNRLVLIDFGLASFADRAESFGTRIYLPPEEAIASPGERISGRRSYDVYATCMTLVLVAMHCRLPRSFIDKLEERRAFVSFGQRRELLETLCGHMESHYKANPDWMPLFQILGRGIDACAAHRWGSARELLEALRAVS